MAATPTATSFVTADPELFDAARDFYVHELGFIVNQEWTVRDSSHAGGVHRAYDSLRETTLFLGNNGDLVVIFLRESAAGTTKLESQHKRTRLLEAKDKLDWRGISSAVLFPLASFPEKLLKCESQPRQSYPTFGDPAELYFVDPLGNLIGFTNTANAPVSTKYHRPTLEKTDVAAGLDPRLTVAPGTQHDDIKVSTSIKSGTPEAETAPRRRIGVLTSGGDAPGMNAAVRAVVRHGIYRGCEVYAIYEGYEGLVQGGDLIKPMQWDDVRGFLGIGGTVIGTARCAAFRERAGRLKACHHMLLAGIDALVVCGGDGSLTGADLFRAEWPSLVEELRANGTITDAMAKEHQFLNIAGLVGSIDNDMALTDATIGAYSSLDRICTTVDWIEATAESHSRAFVIEVMGRHCGWLALMAAIATRADYVFIPELPPVAGQWADKMNRVVRRHRAAGARRTIVIVAEGAIDDQLQPVRSEDVKVALQSIGLDTRVTTFGHIQRGGSAVAMDRLMATMQGAEAVDAILDATPETPSPVIGIRENKTVRVNLQEAVRETKLVAEAIGQKEFDKARSYRDSEFNEHLRNYLSMSQSDLEMPRTGLKIGIIAVGAPAGGMNAAVGAAASYCLSRGHEPVAIRNSWSGLARHESLQKLSWLDIYNTFGKGGCDIGTNRTLPDVDFGMIAYYLAKHEITGLIIIGGFEAFKSLHMLDEARTIYPAFRIPMTCLPATISNNVPGTEASLGTDTCLNALVNYCDVVKQSASSTRRRVFIVEVQGGQSGYIAACSALVTGAYAVYTPEEGISLTQMSSDIKHLRSCFEQDAGRERAGRLVIRNELASPGFTTANLTAIFEAESHGKFDVREAIPGHLQQGGLPSSIDHVRATRLGIRCVQWLETMTNVDWKDPTACANAAAVIGVKSSKVRFTPVRLLWENETDIELRRSTKVHWGKILQMANIMTLRPVVHTGHVPSSG